MKHKPLVAAAVVGIVIVIAAYLPSLRVPFYFDDYSNVVNPQVINSADFSVDSLIRIATSSPLPRRFVANLSFALNHRLLGSDPRSFHLVNLGIHLAVGAALAWVVLLYLRRHCHLVGSGDIAGISLLVSFLFLVHPLNTQAVTYVVQRMASLAGLFVLLGFGCYVWAREREDGGPSWPGFWLAIGFWLAGLFTKETAVAALPLVAVYEAAFHRRQWRRRFAAWWGHPVRRAALVCGTVVGVLLIATAVRQYAGEQRLDLFEVMPRRDFTGLQRMLTQTRVQVFYLSLLVWPSSGRLNLDHDIVLSRSLTDPPSTLFAAIFWILVVVGVGWLTIRHPKFGFPPAAYLVLHVLESGPINIELIFEHRMYVPMAAAALALAVCLAETAPSLRRPAVVGLIIVGVAFAVATHRRNSVWAEPVVFFANAASKSPGSFRANFNYGTELAKRGRLVEARAVLEKAAAIDPERSDVYNQLGNIGLLTGDLEFAARNYELSVERDPKNAAALYNLGLVFEKSGRSEAAVDAYRRFIDVATAMPHLAPTVADAGGRIQRLNASRHGLERSPSPDLGVDWDN